MYPLNVTNSAIGGYAVANDEQEHIRLSEMGYEPRIESDADPAASDDAGHTVESLRAQLDALGIPYDKRYGLARLLTLIPTP